MSNQRRVSHPIYNLLPTGIDGFDALLELALDLRWSWNHATDEVWRTLDPVLWEITQNPWVVLQTVARDKLEHALSDPVFRKKVEDMRCARREAEEKPAWFQREHPQAPLNCVAYFSMQRRGDPLGRRPHPVAAMIRDLPTDCESTRAQLAACELACGREERP